jgi:hypothetical protein
MSSVLDRVEIAKPCPALWEGMAGDERVRHCNVCKLNVYNLSEMTRKEAEELIIEKEGNLCARVYRRADGTIITNDCPIGVRLVRQSIERCISAAAFLIALFAPGKAVAQDSNHQLIGDSPTLLKLEFGSKLRLIEEDLKTKIERERKLIKDMSKYWNSEAVVFTTAGSLSVRSEDCSVRLKQDLFDATNRPGKVTDLDVGFECDLFNAYALERSPEGMQIQRTLRPAEIRTRAPERINLLSIPGAKW